ncbi:MAG: SAF domain-containing protein, partial [Lachnospiraceae bacterium]|nr:SAF domain-containing protein [Lachnospiraceae bacterium]
MKQAKRETPVKQAAKLWMGAIFAAFLAAGAIYVALLQVEKNLLETGEKKQVYLAAKEIPTGQLVTKENCEEYFVSTLVDASLVPEAAILSVEEMAGLVATSQIDQGVLLTRGMFCPYTEVTAAMQEPVVAGFRAEDLSQVVSGVLRAGDRIHVYAEDEEYGTALIWENVYVHQVFDGSGNVIGNE